MAMKIGFFTGAPLEVYGGTEVWILEVGNRLSEKGHRVFVISPLRSLSRDPIRTRIEPKFMYLRIPYVGFSLGGLKFYRPIYYPDFDVAYLANIGVFPIANNRSILGGHTLFPGVPMFRFKALSVTILSTMGKLVAAHSLTPSQAFMFNRMRFKRVYYIPNGVDCERFKVADDLEDRSVIFIGRLTEQKGIPFILKLAAILRDIKFHIIGDGPLRNMVIEASSRLNNIIYHGFVSEAEKTHLLSRSSVLILPSRYEIMPLTALEAAASGVTVVSFDLKSMRELNIDKILCKDLECFVNSIKKLTRDYTLERKISVRERAAKYCWNNIINKIEKMFIEVRSGL